MKKEEVTLTLDAAVLEMEKGTMNTQSAEEAISKSVKLAIDFPKIIGKLEELTQELRQSRETVDNLRIFISENSLSN
jgi:hypothetical protein